MFWTIIAWIGLVLLAILLAVLGYVLLVRIRLQVALGLHSASGEALPERLRLSAGSLFYAETATGPGPPPRRSFFTRGAQPIARAGSSDSLWLRWRLLWWTGAWRPLEEPFPERWKERFSSSEEEAPSKAEEKAGEKHADDKPQSRSSKRWMPTPGRILVLLQEAVGSFHIAQFHADIDTGNWALNGQLYPIAAWAQARGHSVHLNFRGYSEVALDAWIRIGHLLWALLRGLLKPKPKRPTAAAFFRSLGIWIAGYPTPKSRMAFAGPAKTTPKAAA